MTDESPQPGEENGADVTAAELVLGLLEGAERERAAALLRDDAGFRAEVARWRDRLAPLLEDAAATAPTADLWPRIAAAIGSSSNVVPLRPRTRVWESLTLWRATAGVSLAAAAALLAVVVLRPSPPPAARGAAAPPPVLVATLAAPDGKALFVATLDRARRGVAVVPVAAIRRGERWPELWIIPAGGKPTPVGMVDAGAARLVRTSPAVVAEAGGAAVLAVSLEPKDGSPTGAPTGSVIATGTLRYL